LFGVVMLLSQPTVGSSPLQYDATVTGTGDPGQDIAAVQEAVDQGGTVLLKGTFVFGEEGRVNITRDIKINGEKDAKGMPLTTIQGGFWTFHSPLPAQLPITAPGPDITIQDMGFEGALWSPIYLGYCRAATIRNNRITNVRPKLLSKPLFGKEGFSRQQGIVLTPRFSQPEEKYQPGAVTGTLSIENNDISMHCDDPEKTMSQGVYVLWTTGALVKVTGNSIRNCSKNSIEVLDNCLDANGKGMVMISENRIVTATKGPLIPTPSTPNGIVAGWFLDLSGGADPARNCKIVIVGNDIETRGPSSLGIVLLADRAVVAQNKIVIRGGPKARAIAQFGSDGFIADNSISGTGLAAVFASPFKQLAGSRNTFLYNQVSGFQPSAANVILKSSHNVVCGDCGKISAPGKDNQIFLEKP